MTNRTVSFKGRQQNKSSATSSVSLQIFDWTTGVDSGDKVTFANHSGSNMPIKEIKTSAIMLEDEDGNGIDTFGPIAVGGSEGPYTVVDGTSSTTVKYTITYDFEEGEDSASGTFVIDPRFIYN